MQKYKSYKRSADHSYAVGIFPTIELLTSRPQAVEAVFVAPNSGHSQGIQKVRSLCAAHNIQCIEDAKTIARIARDDHSFAVGVFKKFVSQLAAERPHIVLVSPDDAGNVGTILRTMLGFNHHDLAIINPAVDTFDPKTVRASMGAVFKQHVAYFNSFDEYVASFPQHNPYPFVLQTANLLGNTPLEAPYALVFGNEGSGLPAEFANIGTPVRIEQTNEIDSLNLAVSVSVVLYTAFSRK
jgi:TrmH family RNA methyltransferase